MTDLLNLESIKVSRNNFLHSLHWFRGIAVIFVVIFDIQDVGVRFYTYISTMQYAMEAAAEHGKQFMVLDRPNPNGHYVDGPVLDKSCTYKHEKSELCISFSADLVGLPLHQNW